MEEVQKFEKTINMKVGSRIVGEREFVSDFMEFFLRGTSTISKETAK